MRTSIFDITGKMCLTGHLFLGRIDLQEGHVVVSELNNDIVLLIISGLLHPNIVQQEMMQ